MTIENRLKNKEEQIVKLQGKYDGLLEELKCKDRVIFERKNQVDAYHHVWCTAACGGSMKFPEEVTEELVKEAEWRTRRLRTWFENNEFKKNGRKITWRMKLHWWLIKKSKLYYSYKY